MKNSCPLEGVPIIFPNNPNFFQEQLLSSHSSIIAPILCTLLKLLRYHPYGEDVGLNITIFFISFFLPGRKSRVLKIYNFSHCFWHLSNSASSFVECSDKPHLYGDNCENSVCFVALSLHY